MSVLCAYFWDRKVYRTEDPRVKPMSFIQLVFRRGKSKALYCS